MKSPEICRCLQSLRAWQYPKNAIRRPNGQKSKKCEIFHVILWGDCHHTAGIQQQQQDLGWHLTSGGNHWRRLTVDRRRTKTCRRTDEQNSRGNFTSPPRRRRPSSRPAALSPGRSASPWDRPVGLAPAGTRAGASGYSALTETRTKIVRLFLRKHKLDYW